MLLHGLFRGYREGGSRPVSDRHSEQTRGNSPVLPQGMMQLHRRQKILTLEWFCKGAGSLDGAVKSLPSAASVLGSGVSLGWRPLQSYLRGRKCLWLLGRDKREGRKLEKLICKNHAEGTYDYKDKTKCAVAVWAQRVFLMVLKEPVAVSSSTFPDCPS